VVYGELMVNVRKLARSFLFVPATRPDRLSKAFALQADEIIFDLEDSVGDDMKTEARDCLSNFSAERPVFIRINAVGSVYFDEDIAFLNNTSWFKGVVLPKVGSSDDIHFLRGQINRDVDVLALVETPQGIVEAENIALSGANRILFGTADYSSSLNAPASDELFAYPRSRLALASAFGGLPAPVDGPTLDFENVQKLGADLKSAKALGMGGKLCIHPAQLSLVSEAFGPTQEERVWAKTVLELSADEGAVFALNGELVDAPVLARARWIEAQ
jgi:citrate lyase subunit beta / citryl-CoA lyase